MSRLYWMWLVIVFGLIVVAIVFAAGNLLFIDVPSMIVVLVPVLAMSFAAFSPREMRRSFHAAFSREAVEPGELKAASVFFAALSRYIILSGLIGVLTGIISLLGAISRNPDVKSNAAGGFALLLVSAFYAIILLLVVAVPFRAAVDKKLARSHEGRDRG